MKPDSKGRLHLRATGIFFSTGEDGWGLKLRDAATGELLRAPAEVAAAEAQARREAEAAWQQAQAARRDAARRAEKEAAARRAAEAEVERLRQRRLGSRP